MRYYASIASIYADMVKSSLDAEKGNTMKTQTNGSKENKLFQVVRISADGKSAEALKTISAENMKTAYNLLSEAERETNRIYPYAALDNAESIYNLAKYVVRNLIEIALSRNTTTDSGYNGMRESLHGMRDDMIQTAALAIVECLTDGENNMFAVYRSAYRACEKMRNALANRSAREFSPDWIFNTLSTLPAARATYPRLCAAIRAGKSASALSEKQIEVIEAYERGITCADICAANDITKRAYYTRLYSALYAILCAAVDTDSKAFFEAGFSRASVNDALAMFAKRARVKTVKQI